MQLQERIAIVLKPDARPHGDSKVTVTDELVSGAIAAGRRLVVQVNGSIQVTRLEGKDLNAI
jgi:hypothetical protein